MVEEGDKAKGEYRADLSGDQQNQTKIDAFKAKAKEAETQLTALQGNATLTSFCAAQKTQGDCRLMARWQKMADMAKNQTALDAKFKGDETKVQEFQAKVTGFQAKLDAMMGNATLMDTCKTMAQGTLSLLPPPPPPSPLLQG